MFTTLRYVKDTALVPEREGHVLAHLACKACRSRKLKCTGESNGCRRCLSKDVTCTYPDPSQRTRRSRDIQKRAKSKLASQVPLPSASINTEDQVSDRTIAGHELTPAPPSPWAGAAFKRGNDGSFLDAFLGDGSMSEELSFLSEDIQVEGAGFFPLDHYSCLDDFLGTGWSTSTSSGLIDNSPLLSSSFPTYGPQLASSTGERRKSPEPRTLMPTTPTTPPNLLPTSSSSLPPSPSPHQTPPQCNCLPTALQMLSAITINESSIRNIPRTIRLNKYVLQQSKTLFSCTSCSDTTAASTMTILTVLCQKVTSSYEHVVYLLAKQYYALHHLSMDNVPTYLRIFDDVEVEEGRSEQQFQLSEYEVEKFEEPCLFSGLVTLQLGILREFLLRLKEAPERLAGEYFTLLDSVDERVMKLGRFCSASCEV